MTAIGVLHALDETTHKVARDISVVGFDDIHLAQFMLPPLTTVQMSCADWLRRPCRRCAPASSRTTRSPRRRSGRFATRLGGAPVDRLSRGARCRRWGRQSAGAARTATRSSSYLAKIA
jgi:hypothetical protein